ncbi:MAG: metallophosphoesterase family protein, partial [Candidatus Thermoplasmatota archaeon]|nr:metallophosphoesterase family protein [Candidatus Thermoplasmatota archaeon]
MEIAVISDIHANPLALEAVLDQVQEADRIYCLGDLVGIGPLPAQTLDIMRREDRIKNV